MRWTDIEDEAAQADAYFNGNDLPPPPGERLRDKIDRDERNAKFGRFDDSAFDPKPPALLPLIDIAQWSGPAPSREFVWGASHIPLRTATMLTGAGGDGKSLLVQMLLTCIALGLPCLGMETRQMNVLYLTCEDDADELWRRQAAICEMLGVPLSAVIGKLFLVSLSGEIDTALISFATGKPEATDRWRQLEATCEAHDIRLFSFDNATDMIDGDLNDVHQVAAAINLLTGLAIRRNGAALFLHHLNKAGDDWLGSIAFHNKVRSRLIIRRSDEPGDRDGRVLENPKANYGPSGEAIRFRWFKGAFVRDEDIPPGAFAEIDKAIRDTAAAEAFIACLTKKTEERINVSHASSAGNYAPKLFASMPQAKGQTKQSLEQAMQQLLSGDRIRANEKVFQYDNRTWARGLAEVREGAQRLAQNLHETPHEGCTKAFQEPAETLHKTCTEAHREGSLYTTYIEGAAPQGQAAPFEDSDADDDGDWIGESPAQLTARLARRKP